MQRSKIHCLFDHLVGDGEHARRNGQTERLGGLEVDDQLELARLHYWQIGGVVALENPCSVVAGMAVSGSEDGYLAHQAPPQGIFMQFIHPRDAVMGPLLVELLPSTL